jgi:hypothetical protein
LREPLARRADLRLELGQLLTQHFESKTDAEVSAYLASSSFDKLSDLQQAVIHGVLDEIREGNEAEVDLNLELADEQQAEAEFSFPAPTDPLPWEERPEQADDEAEDAWDDDDDPGLTGENYTERS